MKKITRRTVLKAGTALAGGMAGILATGRAPAFAQGTTVHWIRWNDFVPASDQLLRRELLPEAEKALGMKINFETVNANDLQPRITAAIQSGAGPDLFMLNNNHPQLYAASLVDLADVVEPLGKAEGGHYPLVKANSADGSQVAVDAVRHHRRHDRLPQILVRRGRRHRVPRDLGEVSRGRQEAEGQGPADRPDARSHLRRQPDLHLSLHVVVGRQGSRGRRQDRQHQQQGRRSSRSSS